MSSNILEYHAVTARAQAGYQTEESDVQPLGHAYRPENCEAAW